MNQVHIHLLITHLPIFGSVLAAIVLIYGISRKSTNTLNAAYILFLISAGSAVIAYLTGEGAEETVEHLKGITESAIEEHEDSAKLTLISMGLIGFSSIIALFKNCKETVFNRRIAVVILILSLIGFGFSAYTGRLGGKIRHTELGAQMQPPKHELQEDH